MSVKSVEKKYNLKANYTFSLFIINSTKKKEKALSLIRNIKVRNINMLNLPSAFNLNPTKSIQNPKVILLYSKIVNFKSFSFLGELNASCFRLKYLWYAHFLLKECCNYTNILHICNTFGFRLISFYFKTGFFLNKNGYKGSLVATVN